MSCGNDVACDAARLGEDTREEAGIAHELGEGADGQPRVLGEVEAAAFIT